MAIFNRNSTKESYIDFLIEFSSTKCAIEKLAIEKAKDMIAKVIAKSEFKVMRKGKDGKIKETKDNAYYTLNIKPNPNQTATEFWREVINKYFEGEALIVIVNEQLYLAESGFKVNDSVLHEKIYSNVKIQGLEMNRSFNFNEVLHFKGNSKKVLKLLKSSNELCSDLISVANSGYRSSNAKKFKLRLPGQVAIQDKEGKPITHNEYAKKIEDQLQSDEAKVILAAAGVDLEEIKANGTSHVEDVTKLTNQIIENVAFAFDIPIDVFIGKTTEKSNAMNDFITFAVLYLVEQIDDICNASLLTKEEYLSGEKIFIDMTKVKHVDVIESAINLDKLFSNGFSYNDICKLLGLPEIDEEWANRRYVTKNYENTKGGENNE